MWVITNGTVVSWRNGIEIHKWHPTGFSLDVFKKGNKYLRTAFNAVLKSFPLISFLDCVCKILSFFPRFQLGKTSAVVPVWELVVTIMQRATLGQKLEGYQPSTARSPFFPVPIFVVPVL